MSDVYEDLLGRGIDKKRIVKVIGVAVLLVGIFAWQTTLFSFLLGTQRQDPNEELRGTDYYFVNKTLILPPLDFLDALLDMLDGDELDALKDMMDGYIDDLNVSAYAALLAALMGSEIEVFRVYDYDAFVGMSDTLWKYECFDEYTGTEWTTSAPKLAHYFTSSADFNNIYKPQGSDDYQVKLPISPNFGANSLVVPTLFPNPYVIEDTVQSNTSTLETSLTALFKNQFNSTMLDLFFNDKVSSAIKYKLFALAGLPTNDDLNNTAVDEDFTPAAIKSQYLQLPPTISAYISANPYFGTHYNILKSIIQPQDNAWIVANKIRNYLQDNFTFGIDKYLDSVDGPQAGEDEIEWFCEEQEGIWIHFASTFTAFARAFNVSARFVDGFNSRDIIEGTDPNEFGKDYFSIKYKNMYNWAEVYIPTDVSGSGLWVEMDVQYETYGVGGNPMSEGNFSIIDVTSTSPIYFRGQSANVTATLYNSLGSSVENKRIYFINYLTGTNYGYSLTDINGTASKLIALDNTEIVGPQFIMASYQLAVNATGYYLIDTVDITLNQPIPNVINNTQTNTTNILGYMEDPNSIGTPRIKNATVEFVLLNKGTNIKIGNAFIPKNFTTDNSGIFNLTLNVTYGVSPGNYEIRVDFNGTWDMTSPFPSIPTVPPMPLINGSSNRELFNITTEIQRTIFFYIDGYPSGNAIEPNTTRGNPINLTAIVYNTTSGNPVNNTMVYFYDFTNNSRLIYNGLTGVNGNITYFYNPGFNATAGPNLLYAQVGGFKNYSYFILDAAIAINITSGPTPAVINRSGGGYTTFNIQGSVFDPFNNARIPFSYVNLSLIKNGYDNSSYLTTPFPFSTGPDGSFSINYDVLSNTPPGNYTLNMTFTGRINLGLGGGNYPYSFDFYLSNFSSFFILPNEVKIEAPDIFFFDFRINGTTVDDQEHPVYYRWDNVNLSVYLQWGASPIADGEWVTFYDVTSNLTIGSAQTLNGYASFNFTINNAYCAGPNLLYATWNNFYNYSYFILDAPIQFQAIIGPSPSFINQSSPFGRSFSIEGNLSDTTASTNIKYGAISVHLFDNTTEVSFYLIPEGGSLQLDETGHFLLTYRVSSATPTKDYTVQIWYNGTFLYTSPPNDLSFLTGFNNPHAFYLSSFSNFSTFANGFPNLTVSDPYNVDIYLKINGSATQSTYDNLTLPERFNRGDIINFTVRVNQNDQPVNTSFVRIYDVYNNSFLLAEHNFTLGENGTFSFYISTASWYAGLHYIKVNWSSFSSFNTTYVIINESMNINAFSPTVKIIRGVDSMDIWGNVTDGVFNLRGLNVNLRLINSSLVDVSGFITSTPVTLTIDNLGKYQFSSVTFDANTPQGLYYIRIDFNGSIDAPGITLSDYLIHNSSILLNFNITVNVTLTGNYDTLVIKDGFYEGDTLNVFGNLTWDNGSPMSGMRINITIMDGAIQLASANGTTDIWGGFDINLTIGVWPDTANVMINFYPTHPDNFGIPNGYYVLSKQIEVFRI
jgi:hypothetical protein